MAKANKGFSLVELAIVLVIIGILVSITLGLGVAQVDVAKRQATQAQMDKINNAMAVFLKTNGYLPCPAGPTLATTNGSWGVSSTTGGGGTTCSTTSNGILTDTNNYIYVGVVPTRTLNLPDSYMYDAWGNRITYVVTTKCLALANWAPTGTSYPPTTICGLAYPAAYPGVINDKITIYDASGNTITTIAAYIIISHGKNGGTVGAWNKSGTKVSSVPGPMASNPTSNPEMYNGNYNPANGVGYIATNAKLTYSDAQFNDGSISSNYYDDIVRWKTAIQLDYDANH